MIPDPGLIKSILRRYMKKMDEKDSDDDELDNETIKDHEIDDEHCKAEFMASSFQSMQEMVFQFDD